MDGRDKPGHDDLSVRCVHGVSDLPSMPPRAQAT